MHTKFKKWYTKELEDRLMSKIQRALDTTYGRRKFLEWMTKTFGDSSNRWSIRWSTLGVDIRFSQPKDYFRFTMFHSIDPENE